MTRGSWTLIVAGMIAAVPVAAQGPPEGRGPCGAPDADVRAELIEVLTAPEHADTRERMQLTGLTADDLVELGGAHEDTPVCARLLAALPSEIDFRGAQASMAATLYRAGERYIVAIRARPINENRPKFPGPDLTWSYTMDFRFIAGYARR